MNKQVNYNARELAGLNKDVKEASVSTAKEVISLFRKAFEDTVVPSTACCRAVRWLHLARARHIFSCTDDMPITP